MPKREEATMPSEAHVADALRRAKRWLAACGFDPQRSRCSNPDDEQGFLVSDLAAALEYMSRERDQWNKQARQLSGGLLAIHSAPDGVTIGAARSVAYDVALNCIKPDIAEFQLVRRSTALNTDKGESA